MTTNDPDAGRAALAALDAAEQGDETDRHHGDAVDYARDAAIEVLNQLADRLGFWTVRKVRHDQNAAVGPVVLTARPGWIDRSAGTSDPTHTRVYAAQLLAAADESERLISGGQR